MICMTKLHNVARPDNIDAMTLCGLWHYTEGQAAVTKCVSSSVPIVCVECWVYWPECELYVCVLYVYSAVQAKWANHVIAVLGGWIPASCLLTHMHVMFCICSHDLCT